MRPPQLGPIEAFEAIQRILDDREAVSWTEHARERAIARNFTADDVIRVLRTGTVSGTAEWDDRYRNWKYVVSGRDCDNAPLALVIALEPVHSRITLITGKDV